MIVLPLWKHVAKRMAVIKDGLVSWKLRGQYYCGDVSSEWVDLAYDNGNLLVAVTNLLGPESSLVFLTLDSVTLSQG